MARHRNVRSMDYEDELDDYASDDYGTSLEKGCITPDTEHMYTYARERHGSISKFLAPQTVTEEDEEPVLSDGEDVIDTGEIDPGDRLKFAACLEQVQDVMGDEISEARIREVARSQNFDPEKTVNFLLENPHSKVDKSISDLLDQPFNLEDILGTGKIDDEPALDIAELLAKPAQPEIDIGNILAQSDLDLNSLLQTTSSLEELLSTGKKCADLDINRYLPEKDENALNDLLRQTKEEVVEFDACSIDISPMSTTFKHMVELKNFTTFKTFLQWTCRYFEMHKRFAFDSPSPDDVFRNARQGVVVRDSKKTQPEPTPKTPKIVTVPSIDTPTRMTFSGVDTTPKPKPSEKVARAQANEVEKSLAKAKLAPETPRTAAPSPKPIRVPRVKPEQILSEYKENRGSEKPLLNLVVVGHVDAGKSTLVGHLLCLMGSVQKKTMDGYEHEAKKVGRASFAYAWVLDSTPEERQRGITMDMSEAKFVTKHRQVNILDAPGHKDFIPNMITGAAQADVAVLVVDATTGEFETGFELGGQTREHTMLLRALGVTKLTVAVNKLDNCNWSKSRFDAIVTALKPFLKQAGYSDKVQFVPCSGYMGENLSERSKRPELSEWYTGPCLVEIIDGMEPPVRSVTKPLRLCVNDIFKGHQSGICVAGKIETGSIAAGDKVIIMPAQESCVVKGITIEDLPQKRVYAGDSILMNLEKFDPTKLTIGSIICDPNDRIKIVTKFEAQIVVFNIETAITKGTAVILHFQSLTEQATVTKLVKETNRTTGEALPKKPRFLMKNTSGVVVMKVSRPVSLELYADFKELGRITLRQAGKTIAAGIVTKVLEDTSMVVQ